MVDYAHLPVLELLRQIDARVRTATEQSIETQTDLSYKVAKDLAEFVQDRIHECKSYVEAQKEGLG